MKTRGVLLLLVMLLVPSMLSAAPCQTFTYTGMWGEVTTTAVVVNPQGPVTGEIDATGCDIGVFFGLPGTRGLVENATIHGARVSGVLVAAGTTDVAADVVSSSIYDIGDPSNLSLGERGAAISYRSSSTGIAAGKVTGNVISRYPGMGIYLEGADVQISDNTISGLRSGWFCANAGQTGIVSEAYSNGARVTIDRNTIVGNIHINAAEWWMSSGIAGQFPTGSQITRNLLVNNENGICVLNEGTGATRVTVAGNRITADDVYSPNNTQFGIWMTGTKDKLGANTITGYGYDPATKPGYTYPTWIWETDPRGNGK